MNVNNKLNSLIQLFAGIIVVILLNIIGNYVFHRFDLTTEKRYSLSPSTKAMLKDLDDVVYFKVYLEGNFPAGFKRLRNETKEMLDEFRAYGGDNIQYTFINPSEDGEGAKSKDIYEQLMKQGLQPTSLQVKTESGEQSQLLFPGAIVTYHDKLVPLQLLKNSVGTGEDEILNNSVQNLEFELASCLRKLTTKFKKKIAFIEGHGELSKEYVEDITKALEEFYVVERVRLNGQIGALKGFQAAIIAKPDSAFSEKDKFILDQFVMNGKKTMWLIDPVMASMDSLTKNNATMGLANPINLDDLLFRYGVRLNTNLVLDIQAAPIPVFAGYVGNQPQQRFYPWPYFPVAFPFSNHPMVKNLNAVKFEFASSIDTVGNRDIHKTILLATSKYSKVINTPARIDLSIMRKEPSPKEFNKSFEPLAVLLEGKFESNYKNRIAPEVEQIPEVNFKKEIAKNAMIIVSDGDIIKNQIQKSTGKVYALGYDRYTKQEFGNKIFILNCMNYLLDDSGLISIRSREIKLRLLDKTIIQASKLKWQIINIVLPVVLVLMYGIIANYRRKRKYGVIKSK